MKLAKFLSVVGALLLFTLTQCQCAKESKNMDNKNDVIPPVLTPDKLEIQVTVTRINGSEFRIDYILTNRGAKPVYRVVPEDSPHYYVLIRPFRMAFGEGKSIWVPYANSEKASEILILSGMEQLPDNVEKEYPDEPTFVELAPAGTEKGTLTVKLPFQTSTFYGYFDRKAEKRAEHEINKMIQSEKGAPCVVAFAYLLREDCTIMPDGTIAFGSIVKSRLAFSNSFNLRIIQ